MLSLRVCLWGKRIARPGRDGYWLGLPRDYLFGPILVAPLPCGSA